MARRPALVGSVNYIVCDSLRLVVAVCQKVASTSLQHTLLPLRREGDIPPNKAEVRELRDAEGYRVAQFVRHPYDRIVSAYEFFFDRFERVNAKNGRPEVQFWYNQKGLPGPRQFSFDEFVLGATRRFFNDKHVQPQYLEHLDEHGQLATWLWPLDDSERGWAALRAEYPELPPMQTRNVTDKRHEKWQTYLDNATANTRRLLAEFYKGDLAFYADAEAFAEEYRCKPR